MLFIRSRPWSFQGWWELSQGLGCRATPRQWSQACSTASSCWASLCTSLLFLGYVYPFLFQRSIASTSLYNFYKWASYSYVLWNDMPTLPLTVVLLFTPTHNTSLARYQTSAFVKNLLQFLVFSIGFPFIISWFHFHCRAEDKYISHSHVNSPCLNIGSKNAGGRKRLQTRRLLLEIGKRIMIMFSYDSQLLLPSGDSWPVFKDTRTVN